MRLTEKYWVLADQVVVSGSGFATNLLLARMLGIDQYGLFSAILMAQLLILSLLQAGISGLAPVLLAHMPANEQKSYTSGLFWFHQSIITLLFVAGVLLFSLVNAEFPVKAAIGLAALCTGFLYFMQDYLRRWLLGTRQAAKACWIDSVTNVLQLGLLLLLYITKQGTLYVALWVIALTYIPSIALGLWWVKPGRPEVTAIRHSAKLHSREGKWLVSSALLQWTAGNFYVVAAGWWLGAAALGALRLGQYIFGLLNVLLQAFENYALPRAAALHQNSQALFALLKKILLQLSILMLPVLLVLALFGKQLMRLAGGETYTDYSYVMGGLALLYVFIVIGYPIRIALRVQLLNKHYFFGYVLATAFSMATAAFVVRQYELYGVLAGMLLAQCILLGYWLYVLQLKKSRV